MKTLVVTITVEMEVADDTTETDVDNYVDSAVKSTQAAIPGAFVESTDWDLEG